jgi:hypothetical protein
LAAVAPGRRLEAAGRFAAQIGNRGMARLALARSPAPPPAHDLPAVDARAAGVLAKLGLSDASIAAFHAGQMVLFNLDVADRRERLGSSSSSRGSCAAGREHQGAR